ncbi:LysR family transcriptional regulator [Acetonema longum]|uniref:Transcriptional regulator n=1 Tax=Acetonema longum DSM 6540 TaxID=1009370 RepID=F7NNY6_9FIRM|nr:LysR family transcriptional regulator [Acetonema longum]EGO62320.1 transcriptional regulator [Acetonema longum DSM 6540]
MDDRDWRILQVLFEQKNITKTAQALFISQPALTARLRQIEAEFGVKIAYRTSKGVQFTPQGEYLAKCAAQTLFNLRQIKEQVMNLENKVAGTLRLGASSYFTMFMLPPLLKLFQRQYPDVEFKVTTTWSKDIHTLVYNQEVHVGFVSSDYDWQGQKLLLFEEPICIASMNKIDVRNLPNLPRINYQTDALIKNLIDKWWRERFSQPPTINMEVDRLVTCKEMVKNGLGYGIMPHLILNGIENLHKIYLTDKQGKSVQRKTWMIYHQEFLEMNLFKVFVNFVKKMNFTDILQIVCLTFVIQ